jgi:predicted O-linked N-acetylglucosamine transferase (SPINDLY family)
MDVNGYFAALASTDIALDTMPYNGATTTLDALWMGVPVVALAGDRSVARSGISIMHTVGLPELVARTPGEYVAINVRLAQNHAWRDALRLSLRERLRASPLMDGAGFTRDLEERLAALCG